MQQNRLAAPTARRKETLHAKHAAKRRTRQLLSRPIRKARRQIELDLTGMPAFALRGAMRQDCIDHGNATRRVAQRLHGQEHRLQRHRVGFRTQRGDQTCGAGAGAAGADSAATLRASSRWICFHIGEGPVCARFMASVR